MSQLVRALGSGAVRGAVPLFFGDADKVYSTGAEQFSFVATNSARAQLIMIMAHRHRHARVVKHTVQITLYSNGFCSEWSGYCPRCYLIAPVLVVLGISWFESRELVWWSGTLLLLYGKSKATAPMYNQGVPTRKFPPLHKTAEISKKRLWHETNLNKSHYTSHHLTVCQAMANDDVQMIDLYGDGRYLCNTCINYLAGRGNIACSFGNVRCPTFKCTM